MATNNNNAGKKRGHSFLKAKSSNIPLPVEVENTKEDVINWGKNNMYPYYLNFLKKNNPIHGGIIGSKVHYTTSGGLVYDGADTEAWNTFYNNNKSAFGDKNLDELMVDWSEDFETSDMFVYLVKFNIIGMPKTLKKIERIPFEKVRFEYIELENKQIELTGKIKVSDDWSNTKLERETFEPYNGQDDQIQFYLLYRTESGQTIDNASGKTVNQAFYPSPTYSGAITPIDTGIEINKYNNAEIHNGFSLGTAIHFGNGRIDDAQEKKNFEEELRAAATGSDQTGGIFITYGLGEKEKTHVEHLNGNDLPDRYTNAKQGTEESIIHAHSITTPILFGIKTEGSLGNATELEIGYSIMKANYFEGRQMALITPLNWIAKKFAGLQGDISFAEVPLNLETQIEEDGNKAAEALNKMSPLVATKVLESMTPNEIRALAALESVEGGDDLATTTESTEIVLKDSHTCCSKNNKFDAEEVKRVIELFKEHGRNRSEVKCVKSYALTSYENVKDSDCMDKFKSEFQALSDELAQIMNLIKEGNNFDNIRKALEMDSLELAKLYRRLINDELLTSEGEITELGNAELAASDIERLEILYEYALRPDAPDLVPGGESRDFCRTLIALDRLYTREEIDIISLAEGYNVFAYRGGWYHNPDTETNQPGCRHEWRQVVTFV